jgi:ABC-2 type transport system permease protein
MNREHFKAFLWLRWRLRVNQFRKAGAVNAAIMAVFAGFCLIAAVILFIVGIFVGLLAFQTAPAYALLFTWDGIVVAFLFSWMIGMLTDLQRSEALSLDRFLHLPVSLSGAFLINYLSSLFTLSLIVFVPGAIGLVIGLTISKGLLMLLELPLLAAALFALTAVTYQFQGWLASLMNNPRRRRTVIVLVTGGFILIAQTPNLINIVRPWEDMGKANTRRLERETELNRLMNSKEITPAQFSEQKKASDEQYDREQKEASEETGDRVMRTGRILNTVLPPGWLPLGAEGLAEGAVIPASLGFLGLTLIGTVSLRRSYRTTLRLYTGQFTGKERKATAAKVPIAPPDPTRVRMVERQLPWVGETVSAVATAGFRSLTRAPEAKMAFLAPVIMVVVFGGIIVSTGESPPALLRPFLVFAAGGMIQLIAGLQLLANQFGYDRAGFRAFVLSPLSRRDILLGKNLAVAPLVLGLGLIGFVVVGSVYPMRIDHYPAVLAQILSTYMVLCMFTNVLSILTPIALAPGSLQPANIKATPILLQMGLMMLLPVAVVPIMAPYGLEVLLDQLDVIKGVPISLPLSLIVMVLVGFLYRWVIGLQGAWLAKREQKVLEVVTSRE